MLARIRKSMEEKDQGFTLIELLVVMIIIGILAAIAIPVFLNQRKKAVDTGVKADMRTVASEMETAFVDAQAYPGTTTFQASSAVVPDAKTTGTSTISVKRNAASDGFCIMGYSTKGSADTATTKSFWYDSKLGGLQTAAASNPGTAPTGGAC